MIPKGTIFIPILQTRTLSTERGGEMPAVTRWEVAEPAGAPDSRAPRFWFSIRAVVPPPGDDLAMRGDFGGCPRGGECHWYLGFDIRNAAKHPSLHSTVRTPQNNLVSDVSCAQDEKSPLGPVL